MTDENKLSNFYYCSLFLHLSKHNSNNINKTKTEKNMIFHNAE